MAYTTPQFNLTASIWHSPATPPDPPSGTLPCQLYANPRPYGQDFTFDVDIRPVYVRVPKGSDLRIGDIVDPDGSGDWLYEVIYLLPMHLGFTNEYLVGISNSFVLPPPPPGNAILLEDGFYLLLEDGFKLLLE